MIQGKKILLGITGSIAAYKAAVLLRQLIKAGAEVQVVMTPAAADFVAPLTFGTLSKRPVLTGLVTADQWNNHVALGRWADLMLIAPASVNTIAKMARGLCDNLLTAVYLSATCPVMLAPAMDEDMWKHPATRRNLDILSGYGHILLPVEEGELASGLRGPGRMAEPEAILARIDEALQPPSLPLQGKTALVTAGPTREAIDPVRFIGNHSSGKMGIAIAGELARQGAAVELVLGPVSQPVPAHPGIRVTAVTTAEEMYNACLNLFKKVQLAVLAAAVADYRPARTADRKIKKQTASLQLQLEPTPDILLELGKRKKKTQLLAGFSLETDHEQDHALAKIKEKHLDMIVLNSLRDEGAGFLYDTNKITIYTPDGIARPFPLKPKTEVARDIVATLLTLKPR
ncbi:bifunctional phosphopantothenoylcysteine decarboxylase/phosphopantothenate--cysteine ligase CoaBC [Compostibacter hankyongensis]|uniref:Coenzyme A biosynthesis bifunctional protein CoaBC n=1 Tax=Compostibacter hankyongensis TaxID=1007089 RepID=A0ABP8FH93_9BACT